MHTDDILKEIKADVKEVKIQVLELVRQGAVANTTLIEHERRSTNLETRVKPIEDTSIFVHKLALVASSGGMVTLLLALLRYLSK